MKVICAPDSFKGSLTALQAANAMADGVQRAAPGAEVDRCPIGDGGEGTLESLLESVKGQNVGALASDVFGQVIKTTFGSLGSGRIAFVEAAAVIGLAAIRTGDRDVMRSSSYGVGQLIMQALDTTPEKIIIGVGGSATNDGGCGMAQALGVRFFDIEDQLIVEPISGGRLRDIRRIDATRCGAGIESTKFIVACDVQNPLTGPEGAASVYGPQKGANATQVALLDDGLRRLAELIRRDLGVDVENIAGAGAAGGLGAGLVAFAGAEAVSGIDIVLEAVQFDSRVQNADLCLTGEGSLDAQSLAGKACVGVARAASAHDVPTIVLAGQVGPGAAQTLDAGVTEYIAIGEGLSTAESIRQATRLLANAADGVARKYLREIGTIRRSP